MRASALNNPEEPQTQEFHILHFCIIQEAHIHPDKRFSTVKSEAASLFTARYVSTYYLRLLLVQIISSSRTDISKRLISLGGRNTTSTSHLHLTSSRILPHIKHQFCDWWREHKPILSTHGIKKYVLCLCGSRCHCGKTLRMRVRLQSVKNRSPKYEFFIIKWSGTQQ